MLIENIMYFALGLLVWIRTSLKHWLRRLKVPEGAAKVVVRAGPVFVVFLTMGASALFDLGAKGVALVGAVPQ